MEFVWKHFEKFLKIKAEEIVEHFRKLWKIFKF